MGRHTDDITTIDSQFETFSFVGDHKSVFLKMTVSDKTIQAVCDSGASVSWLSLVVFDKLQKMVRLKVLETKSKLVPANKLPFTSRVKFRLLNIIGPKHYDHEFHVFIG